MEKRETRNSNIEILRIIAIIMIIISHYCIQVINEDMPATNNTFSITNKIICDSLTLGDIGVDIFIIIFGFFYDKNKLRLNKIINLILQVLFYSLGIYIILCFLKVTQFTPILLIKSMFPILFQQYWFITAYIIIYILSPFINKFIDSLNRKQYKVFLCSIIIMWGIIPFLLNVFVDFGLLFSTNLTDMLILYFIGAYLRKYEDNIFNNNIHKIKWIITIVIFLMILSIIALNILSIRIPLLYDHTVHFLVRKSPLSIILAVSLFVFYNNKKTKNNKFINKVASLSFGIYLIHAHPLIIGRLWSDVFHVQNYMNSLLLIPHLVFSTAIVYLICALIEYIRQFAYNKLLEKRIKVFANKIEEKFNTILDSNT